MILTSQQVRGLGIVHHAKPDAWQPTTYNATVREIISQGSIISDSKFDLPPRGFVWVVSNEEFELPDTVTGLATLRTTWTHDGILALNTGIVDPGWHGPLAAALLNFSEKPFAIDKGAEFLRIAFHGHDPTAATVDRQPMAPYIERIRDKSAKTSDTFLNMKALGREVIDTIFTLPRWLTWLTTIGLAVAVISLVIAVLAILVPIGWDAAKDMWGWNAKVDHLQQEIDALKAHDHVS